MEIRVLVIPGIELVPASKHFVEPGNVLIEILYRGHAKRKTAVGCRLVDREKLRQGQGNRADRNLVVWEWASRGRVGDLNYFPLGIDRGVRGQVIRKVPRQVGGCGQDGIVSVPRSSDTRPLIAEEDEHAVFLDRTADRPAVLIPPERILHAGEKVAGVEP